MMHNPDDQDLLTCTTTLLTTLKWIGIAALFAVVVILGCIIGLLLR